MKPIKEFPFHRIELSPGTKNAQLSRVFRFYQLQIKYLLLIVHVVVYGVRHQDCHHGPQGFPLPIEVICSYRP